MTDTQPSQSPTTMTRQSNNGLNHTIPNQTNRILSKPSTTITRPRNHQNQVNPQPLRPLSDTGHMSPNSQQHRNNQLGSVAAQEQYVYQMGMARNSAQNGHNSHGKPDDYDPDSNVYVANLPSDYGKDRLYKLFATYGQIVRYKFVTPDEPTQPGYGFVQFANRKDAHRAIKNLEGHVFNTGETIYLSIALRRRSSLSDEPTNLYVKNLPSSWTNEKLRQVFGTYGQIRQSKVVGDGIAFVRFEDHEQALNAIGRLDKQMVDQGCKLEVRFATRKTAANAYRLQQIPQSKTNENNLYIRNLPKYYNQSSLETLFANYGKISSAKINDNGIAFVRFAHAEDAQRAINELNGKKPPQFDEEIVVKLAHFDIGDSRNRWANKFGSGSGGGGGGQFNGNGGHFNNNMYQNHFNAPMGHGSMNQSYAPNPYANGAYHTPNQNPNQMNGTPLPSVPASSVSDTNSANTGTDVNVNVNMNGPLSASITNPNMQQNQQNMMQFGLNSQMQAIQQQMQQFNIANTSNQQSQGGNGNTAAANVQGMNQFAFPQANVMMPAPTLFQNMANANTPQSVTPTHLPNQGIPRQISGDSHHSGSGGASPQSNHSNGSNDAAHKAKTWSKKQQELGDQLYQKVHVKCGRSYAPKITGMLIKMGDKKAQQCIDDPHFLDQQIEIAKKLLENTEGLPASNGAQQSLSPPSLLHHSSGSPTSTTPLMGRVQQFNGSHLHSPNRFQTLNTKPVTPNGVPNINSPNATTPQSLQQQTINQQTLINGGLISSIPNLLTSSIPNSMYGGVPILSTPQLLAMSPAPASSTTPQPHMNGNAGGRNSPNGHLNKASNIQHLNVTNHSHGQQPQYLFTIPNFQQAGVVTSPAQQHQIYNVNGVNVVTTPNSLEAQQQQQSLALQQQRQIQQSGWGLAVNPQINVIQTQPATQFMQPALYPKTQ